MSSDLATRPDAPAPTVQQGSRIRELLASWDTAVIFLTIVVVLGASVMNPDFGSATNFTFLVLDLAPIFLIALPMTLIIVTGEIDLSVASTLGLSGAAMGWMWNNGFTIEAIVPMCILLGALLGALNGFLVATLGLPSLAVTIGTLALFRGLAFVLLGDTAVSNFPRAYTSWVTGTLGDSSVPNLAVPLVILAVVFGAVLQFTSLGRNIYATGASATAAKFAGINGNRIKFWLYVVAGAVAALAGVLWSLRYSSARADNGAGLELSVVAAVLLGGVSIFGGKGRLVGVLAAVVLLAALQNALRLEDISNEALTVVTGVLLIVAVLLPNLIKAVRTSSDRRKAVARL
ncbi:ABC transporter permease [Rhodococcus sp. SORGH_AS_0301]|uniref:ABC transporter permease n=1 Tax=Rhodococcus sp. SORGH_AS_0301 TaxID=3041780 RepID=UPI002788CB2E|nr:ABC transporter permease [Rhodococcus sp. SORGH_AS_0301]MDQ1179177.1 rhamnose transport system permease protein [Rhodococcus sp. SORGH_AS_0301]